MKFCFYLLLFFSSLSSLCGKSIDEVSYFNGFCHPNHPQHIQIPVNNHQALKGDSPEYRVFTYGYAYSKLRTQNAYSSNCSFLSDPDGRKNQTALLGDLISVYIRTNT